MATHQHRQEYGVDDSFRAERTEIEPMGRRSEDVRSGQGARPGRHHLKDRPRLRGGVARANPADMPVKRPTKFELAINMKNRKVIRLTIPQALLLRRRGDSVAEHRESIRSNVRFL